MLWERGKTNINCFRLYSLEEEELILSLGHWTIYTLVETLSTAPETFRVRIVMKQSMKRHEQQAAAVPHTGVLQQLVAGPPIPDAEPWDVSP